MLGIPNIFPLLDEEIDISFLVRGLKDVELLSLEWGMILQLSNIIFPVEKFWRQMSIFQRVGQNNYDVLLDAKEVGNCSNSLLTTLIGG